jgi:phospholipid/cholesterol/gamma-HCH transport system ATP-binding protein
VSSPSIIRDPPHDEGPSDGGARDRRPPDRGDDPVIRVTDLTSSFGDTVVHEGLNLEVRKGEILGLVGGSGAGKSVLLNTLIGLRLPQRGDVEVLGVNIDNASGAERESLERRWGVLFQGGALFSSLTVRENVAAPMHEHTRLTRKMIDQLADTKLVMVGLEPRAGDLHPAELSGGMRKRAGLARAIALDPELLFLDEPTAGLDPISAEAFDTLIRNLSDALGLTVFMITHDLDSLYALCDRVAVISEKKIIAVGPIAELERSDDPWIKAYFLGPRGRAAADTAARAEDQVQTVDTVDDSVDDRAKAAKPAAGRTEERS